MYVSKHVLLPDFCLHSQVNEHSRVNVYSKTSGFKMDVKFVFVKTLYGKPEAAGNVSFVIVFM